MQNSYSAFQEENFGNQGSLVRKRNELLQPVLGKIQEAIQAVSKEEGLSFVFDKAASAVLVFADEKYDVTFKIIDRMKRSK
jgi:outer membrane protein